MKITFTHNDLRAIETMVRLFDRKAKVHTDNIYHEHLWGTVKYENGSLNIDMHQFDKIINRVTDAFDDSELIPALKGIVTLVRGLSPNVKRLEKSITKISQDYADPHTYTVCYNAKKNIGVVIDVNDVTRWYTIVYTVSDHEDNDTITNLMKNVNDVPYDRRFEYVRDSIGCTRFTRNVETREEAEKCLNEIRADEFRKRGIIIQSRDINIQSK